MKKVKKWMIFEGLYLLHHPSDFNFIFWDGFQLESTFSGRNLDQIKDVLYIRRRFEWKRCSFGLLYLCNFFGGFHHCKATIRASEFFWMNFFGTIVLFR